MFVSSFVSGIARHFARAAANGAMHPAEAYYAEVYLKHICDALGQHRQLRIIDGGCGCGRLLVPLAKAGHSLVGIDRHCPSLRLARQHLDQQGLSAEIIAGDVLGTLKSIPSDSFDVALAIESLYVNRNYREVLGELTRVIVPGGLLFVTHRTRHFLLLQAVAEGRFDDAMNVSSASEGRLRKGLHRVYYNWQTRQQITSLYKGLDLQLLRLAGIGCCSGFGNDPLAGMCNPASLTEPQRRSLRRIEALDDEDLVMASRYVLAIAAKPVGPLS